MIKAISLITILPILAISFPAQADFVNKDENTTTYVINIDLPGIDVLPGDFLYFAKRAWESVKSWLVLGKLNQAIYDIDLSNKRLTEIEHLIAQGKIDQAKKTLEKYKQTVEQVEKNTAKVKGTEKKFNDLKEKADYYLYYHRDILANIKNQLPDQEKQSIDEINNVVSETYSQLVDLIRGIEQQ